jgi:hypothetical protein
MKHPVYDVVWCENKKTNMRVKQIINKHKTIN